MKKSGLSILLVLLMLITPIASAFEHCAAMDMSGELSERQNNSIEHQKMSQGVHNNQMDMDCHSSSCTLHICGVYAISSSVPIIHIDTAYYYSIIEYSSPFSTTLSPDLRPPKFIL